MILRLMVIGMEILKLMVTVKEILTVTDLD